MAVIRVPRWPRQEEMCWRQPRGVKPRGTLRGGPERSAEDPQSKPQGSLRRGPARSARDPQLLHMNDKQAKAAGKGQRWGERDAKKRPAIITVDESGEVRNWGPLSKANASRAGSYWEDMDRKVQVLLEKDGERTAVEVEKRINGEKEWFWFREKDHHPQQERPGEADDHPIQEKADHMQEDTPEEKRSEQLDALTEKVASLEKENGELKKAVQEMEAKMAGQVEAIRATCERFSNIETGMMEIVQHVRQHEAFNKSVKTSIDGLENQVRIHQDNFGHVVRIFKNHEEHIAKNGFVSEGMAQYINALVEESEKTKAWVGSLMRESQAQEDVLRQHEMGQQVLAEVIRRIVVQQTQQQSQPQQGQAITGTGPTVTEIDDNDDPERLDFLRGPNPHDGPPNGGTGQVSSKGPRVRKSKETQRKH